MSGAPRRRRRRALAALLGALCASCSAMQPAFAVQAGHDQVSAARRLAAAAAAALLPPGKGAARLGCIIPLRCIDPLLSF